jgi:hypothetical protein
VLFVSVSRVLCVLMHDCLMLAVEWLAFAVIFLPIEQFIVLYQLNSQIYKIFLTIHLVSLLKMFKTDIHTEKLKTGLCNFNSFLLADANSPTQMISACFYLLLAKKTCV